ncbi:MAG: cyclodeaminase/cyclohydrolase family protein [Vicinamibacterales bacterium]
MSFSTQTLDQFLEALSRPEPTPGGGTASAVAGAMGTSLLVMVAGLTKTRANTDAEHATLAAVRGSLSPLAPALLQAADRDAEAFDAVMAAFRLPRATDEDKAARKTAIQRAFRAATETPLETLRLVANGMELGETVARLGNPAAASDVKVAAGLLDAAAAGAAANVRINLESLADDDFRTGAGLEVDQLLGRAGEARSRLEAALP